jgi:hypothetical protein
VRTITFQVDDLVKNLDIMAQVQVPYAAKQTMKRLGFELKRELGQNLQQVFQDPIPITVKSPQYTARGVELEMRIENTRVSKGRGPQEYLFPATTDAPGQFGKKPYLETGLGKFLKRQGYLSPGAAVLSWVALPGVPTTQYGNVQPGFIKAVIQALTAPDPSARGYQGPRENRRLGTLRNPRAKYGGANRYFSVPESKRGQGLAPGIYRVKGASRPERLFAYRPSMSQYDTPTLFDFQGVTRDRSAALLPGILQAEIKRALG